MLTARKTKISELEDSLRKETHLSDMLKSELEQSKADFDELVEKNAKFMKQQLTLDEYRAKAQESVKQVHTTHTLGSYIYIHT
jgi:hypothetical protein